MILLYSCVDTTVLLLHHPPVRQFKYCNKTISRHDLSSSPLLLDYCGTVLVYRRWLRGYSCLLYCLHSQIEDSDTLKYEEVYYERIKVSVLHPVKMIWYCYCYVYLYEYLDSSFVRLSYDHIYYDHWTCTHTISCLIFVICCNWFVQSHEQRNRSRQPMPSSECFHSVLSLQKVILCGSTLSSSPTLNLHSEG